MELDHRTFRMAVERSLGSEFIFSILIVALASVELGPESARLPLTLFTTKRCPTGTVSLRWARAKRPAHLAVGRSALCKEQFHFYRNPPLCVTVHLSVAWCSLSLYSVQPTCVPTCSCLSIQPSLHARTHARTHAPTHLSTHPPFCPSVCLCL